MTEKSNSNICKDHEKSILILKKLKSKDRINLIFYQIIENFLNETLRYFSTKRCK